MIADGFGTGMAGSGKTSLMQRINSHLHMQRSPSYIINLDPAVTSTPYDPNIDIRDTVRQHADTACLAGISLQFSVTQSRYLRYRLRSAPQLHILSNLCR